MGHAEGWRAVRRDEGERAARHVAGGAITAAFPAVPGRRLGVCADGLGRQPHSEKYGSLNTWATDQLLARLRQENME